jgi:putative ABC transport system permease protein
MTDPAQTTRFRFWLWLIRFIGVIVPRRFRARFRQEWEAEMEYREERLARWDRLDWRNKLELLWRSLGAFWDALWLQRQRMEEDMFQDLRFGFRMLWKNPGFTFVAALTLALGIGANTAIFSVVNALMLRPLPYQDPGQLVWIEEVSKKTNASISVFAAHFLDWQAQSRTLAGVATQDGAARTLTGAGEPERVEVGKISASFLPVLGAPLAKGRNFSAAEDAPGGPRVAILSHGLWQRRYNGEPDVVGKTITLNDASFTVIGVLPASFRYFHPYDVWVPLALDPLREHGNQDANTDLPTIARLKPGVAREQAQAELDTILQRYETTKPEGMPRLLDSQTRLVPLQEHFLGDTRRPLLVFLGAVGLVLLIACANVANLLLARAVTRQKELAIRAALGAGRLRLVRQMLTECLLLALAGGAAGLLLADWLTRLLGSLNSADALGEMGRLTAFTIDRRALGFTLLISLLTGLLFGLLPALQFSRPDLNAALKDGGRGGGFHSRGLRSALMVSEVALALALLNVDPGYRAENLLTARLQLPPRYREKSQRLQFYEQTLRRVAALPGVISIGATSHLPLLDYNYGARLRVEGRAPQKGEKEPGAPVASINPDYFRTLGMSLRAGRFFNDADAEGAPSVALLSESLAHKLFPNEDPLGKRLNIAGSGAEWTTVIGVVNDIRHKGLDRETEPSVYLSYRQLPREMALLLRSAAGPASLAPALRNAVREIDPALPVYDVMTMDERLSNSVAARRFNLLLLGGFAALALLLAGVGVYGVISYVVTQRTHEVGIRMALGAQGADVARLFIKQGMAVVMFGVALGLIGAFALTRLMKSLLFDVSAGDPLTFACVALLLSLVAFAACYLPARRAARIDPLASLRRE